MKVLFILLLIMSVGCNKQDNKTINDVNEKVEIKDNVKDDKENIKEDVQGDNLEPINIYLFWGDGCYACANMKSFFDNLDEKYNKYFNLIKYEIWHNEENRNLMYKVGNYLNQTEFFIPFLVIGDEVITGYSESKKEYILDKIIEEYKNDRYDVMKNFKD